MQTIEVQQNGELFSCDIGITKEEWLSLLKEETTPLHYKETILKFFYSPNHRGSCTAVSNVMGGNARKLKANIKEFGRFVQKKA